MPRSLIAVVDTTIGAAGAVVRAVLIAGTARGARNMLRRQAADARAASDGAAAGGAADLAADPAAGAGDLGRRGQPELPAVEAVDVLVAAIVAVGGGVARVVRRRIAGDALALRLVDRRSWRRSRRRTPGRRSCCRRGSGTGAPRCRGGTRARFRRRNSRRPARCSRERIRMARRAAASRYPRNDRRA
jgi:hypothetical protein